MHDLARKLLMSKTTALIRGSGAMLLLVILQYIWCFFRKVRFQLRLIIVFATTAEEW